MLRAPVSFGTRLQLPLTCRRCFHIKPSRKVYQATSNRLDRVLAFAANEGREKVTTAIIAGDATINFNVCNKPKQAVKAGDIVSIRAEEIDRNVTAYIEHVEQTKEADSKRQKRASFQIPVVKYIGLFLSETHGDGIDDQSLVDKIKAGEAIEVTPKPILSPGEEL